MQPEMRKPHYPERFEERVSICMESGLSEGMAYRVAWQDDQRLAKQARK